MDNSNRKCGCNIPAKEDILNIKWQRLVTEGETCPRCGNTEQELDKAIDKVKQVLRHLDIDVILEKEKLNISEFKQDSLQSNRIWINGQPIENIIKGNAGQSPCCDVCGPSDCRTIELNGEKYETIPAELIIQASLAVVNDMISSNNTNSCCN